MSKTYVEVFFPPGTTISQIYDYAFGRDYWPEHPCLVNWYDLKTPYLCVKEKDTSLWDGMS
jgi:hypothetical protein